MLQHPLDDAVGAPPELGDLFQIAGQHPDNLVDVGAFIVVECGQSGCDGLLEFVQQFDREGRRSC